MENRCEKCKFHRVLYSSIHHVIMETCKKGGKECEKNNLKISKIDTNLKENMI